MPEGARQSSRDAFLSLPRQDNNNNHSNNQQSYDQDSASSSLVHLSQSSSYGQPPSRTITPNIDLNKPLPHPDDWPDEAEGPENDDWDPEMPSALDRGKSHTPLLAKDRDNYQDYDSPTRPTLRQRRSTFRERDPEVEAKAATRKKYLYAGCFLILSLISFTVQTETAVYIQHNLKWNKAYCML